MFRPALTERRSSRRIVQQGRSLQDLQVGSQLGAQLLGERQHPFDMIEPVDRIVLRIPGSSLIDSWQATPLRNHRPGLSRTTEDTAVGIGLRLVAGEHQRLPVEGVGQHMNLNPIDRG